MEEAQGDDGGRDMEVDLIKTFCVYIMPSTIKNFNNKNTFV